MSAYTAEGLAKYCEKMLKEKTVYMWGGLMNATTKSFLEYKINQYRSKYKQERINYLLNNWVGKGYASDCVGLIKSYYFGGIGSPNYFSKGDLNTAGMYNNATERGSISKMPDQRGIVVYMSGHVGVYVGNGEVIECTYGTFGDGVVKTKLSARKWTHYLKVAFIDYGNGAETKPSGSTSTNVPYILYTVKKGDSLWKIAAEHMGSGNKYPELAAYNNLDPKKILPVGITLKIPKK